MEGAIEFYSGTVEANGTDTHGRRGMGVHSFPQSAAADSRFTLEPHFDFKERPAQFPILWFGL